MNEGFGIIHGMDQKQVAVVTGGGTGLARSPRLAWSV
jgi:hypothetical protein